MRWPWISKKKHERIVLMLIKSYGTTINGRDHTIVVLEKMIDELNDEKQEQKKQ